MIILMIFVMTKLMEIELVMIDIDTDIAIDTDTDIAIGIGIGNDKTSYVSELTTTHLVKQDDVGMTVMTGIDTDIGHGDLLS